MITTDSMFEHIIAQRPILDRKGLFLFFNNHKVCSISVNRNALKDRAIIDKSSTEELYHKKIKLLTPTLMSHMFKFTIIRNPYDRAVSAFFYLVQDGSCLKHLVNRGIDMAKMSFDRFVLEVFSKYGVDLNIHFHHQHPKVFTPDGTQYVDFIGRLENIEVDWKHIAWSIKHDGRLPQKNVTKHKDFWKYYKNPEVKKIVGDVYAEDFAKLGYTR